MKMRQNLSSNQQGMGASALFSSTLTIRNWESPTFSSVCGGSGPDQSVADRNRKPARLAYPQTTGPAFIRSCLHQDAVNLNMSGVGYLCAVPQTSIPLSIEHA
jgi:hypothetical protein